MKKRFIIGLSLLCMAVAIVVLLLTVPNYGIRLSATDVTPTGATLLCTRIPSMGSVITGSRYFLERYTAKGWVPVTELPQAHDVAWTDEAYTVQVGVMSFQENWDWRYGSLPAGSYRIGKTFIKEGRLTDNQYLTLYAQFKI